MLYHIAIAVTFIFMPCVCALAQESAGPGKAAGTAEKKTGDLADRASDYLLKKYPEIESVIRIAYGLPTDEYRNAKDWLDVIGVVKALADNRTGDVPSNQFMGPVISGSKGYVDSMKRRLALAADLERLEGSYGPLPRPNMLAAPSEGFPVAPSVPSAALAPLQSQSPTFSDFLRSEYPAVASALRLRARFGYDETNAKSTNSGPFNDLIAKERQSASIDRPRAERMETIKKVSPVKAGFGGVIIGTPPTEYPDVETAEWKITKSGVELVIRIRDDQKPATFLLSRGEAWSAYNFLHPNQELRAQGPLAGDIGMVGVSKNNLASGSGWEFGVHPAVANTIVALDAMALDVLPSLHDPRLPLPVDFGSLRWFDERARIFARDGKISIEAVNGPQDILMRVQLWNRNESVMNYDCANLVTLLHAHFSPLCVVDRFAKAVAVLNWLDAENKLPDLPAELLVAKVNIPPSCTTMDVIESIQFTPEIPSMHFGRALAFRAMNKNADAIVNLTRAIDADPTYHWAYLVRGQVLQNSNPDDPNNNTKFNEAQGDFETAIRLYKKHAEKVKRYNGVNLRVSNNTIYDVRCYLQFEYMSADGKWVWWPTDPFESYRSIKSHESILATDKQVGPGEDGKGWIVLARRIRIYAITPDGQEYWNRSRWNEPITVWKYEGYLSTVPPVYTYHFD